MERSQLTKRKLPFAGLQRRVRARKEEEPEPDFEDQQGESSEDESGDEEAPDAGDDDDSEEEDDASRVEDEEDSDDESEDEEANPSAAVSQVSFGALAKAAASLPSIRSKRKRIATSADSDAVSDAPSFEAEERHGKTKQKIASRKNKHAPTEQSSKHAVSRKRQIVEVHKVQNRDPRFGPPLGASSSASSFPSRSAAAMAAVQHEEAARRNYAFLDQYRDSEMATIRAAIRKTKDAGEKEKLQRALMSMQSKKQARQRLDAERSVISEHRRQEKELVKQGKTPFYLKKSETKKRVLVDRFAGMKKGQVDKVIARKRKKETAKERREMPMERRT